MFNTPPTLTVRYMSIMNIYMLMVMVMYMTIKNMFMYMNMSIDKVFFVDA